MITHEVTVVRVPNATVRCEQCDAMTPHLSLAEAINVLGLTEDEMSLLIESGEIHSSAGPDESIQLCGNSAGAVIRDADWRSDEA